MSISSIFGSRKTSPHNGPINGIDPHDKSGNVKSYYGSGAENPAANGFPVPGGRELSGIPSWFVDNCVKTSAEWKNVAIPLTLTELASPAWNATDTKPEKPSVEASIFEMESVVYEGLRVVLSTPVGAAELGTAKSYPARFKMDHVFLRVPYRRSGCGGPVFLRSVVETFAKEIGADLITLSMDDIADLAQSFCQAETGTAKSLNACLRMYFEHQHGSSLSLTGSKAKVTNFSKKGVKGAFPFRAIFHSRWSKSSGTVTAIAEPVEPLIIHLPEAHRFHGSSYRDVRINIISTLREAISQEPEGSDNILLILSSHILDSVDTDGADDTLPMVPVRSRAQMQLLEFGLDRNDYFERKNIRAIQSKTREFTTHYATTIFEPYANWGFLEDSEPLEYLRSRALAETEVAFIVRRINGSSDTTHIQRIIKEAFRRREILKGWNEEVAIDKWSSFPPKIQTALVAIERDDKKYKWEQRFLGQLASPGSLKKGWSDIALDQDTKDSIIQMINQPANTGRGAYGILEGNRIGGALLYGPPGTGKTHLAHIVARECQTTLVSASAADILSKSHGEGKDAIKGLFNLGKIVAPSIILIIDADVIFHDRDPCDRSIISQLLSEVGSLAKVKTPPFVLLETNFPHQIDHAIMRQTPCKLHIGLPSTTDRERIFCTYLRNEQLGDDVDLEALADTTAGYSGSDIQVLCLQAALICEADQASNSEKGANVLGAAHFKKALERSTPTVSTSLLSKIRDFAEEHDPSALSKMVTGGELKV